MPRAARGGWKNLSVSGYRTVAPEPVVPTAWEDLLRELALPEEPAIVAIRSGSALGARLVNFVRDHFHAYFVPEIVLAELGLGGALEGVIDDRYFRADLRKRGGRTGKKGELK